MPPSADSLHNKHNDIHERSQSRCMLLQGSELSVSVFDHTLNTLCYRWRNFLSPDIEHPRKSPFTEWEVAVVVQVRA